MPKPSLGAPNPQAAALAMDETMAPNRTGRHRTAWPLPGHPHVARCQTIRVFTGIGKFSEGVQLTTRDRSAKQLKFAPGRARVQNHSNSWSYAVAAYAATFRESHCFPFASQSVAGKTGKQIGSPEGKANRL